VASAAAELGHAIEAFALVSWPSRPVARLQTSGVRGTGQVVESEAETMMARMPNLAHALDGGIPSLLNVERHRPAASDEQRSAAMCR